MGPTLIQSYYYTYVSPAGCAYMKAEYYKPGLASMNSFELRGQLYGKL